MTRRAAILSTVAVAAALTESARAQERQSVGGYYSTLNLVQPLMFRLRSYRSYTFSLDGESITLTPEEMFAAIKGDK